MEHGNILGVNQGGSLKVLESDLTLIGLMTNEYDSSFLHIPT